ncbi:hypothetical protein D3C75_1286480 [compost metagenome]
MMNECKFDSNHLYGVPKNKITLIGNDNLRDIQDDIQDDVKMSDGINQVISFIMRLKN